jgi:hypothetical protein
MNATGLMWFLAGAGAVLMVQALLRLFRAAAGDGHRSSPEDRRTPPPRSGEIPYRIDQRAMPVSEDLEVLLPPRVGSYERRQLRVPKDIHGDPIYAEYHQGTAMVFVELGICGSADIAQAGVETARRETRHEGSPMVIRAWSSGTDPSFFEVVDPQGGGAFVAWTRGNYYFSAHAKGGQADLDPFMEAFPY